MFFRDEWNVYRYGQSGVHTYHFPGKVDVLSTIGNSIVIYAMDKGLMVYRNKQFERLGEDCPFAGRKVCSLLPLGDAILVVTENDGLWRYDAGRFERVATPFERDLREQIIFCAATDGERIALGTVSSGVFLFDLVGGETFHLDRWFDMNHIVYDDNSYKNKEMMFREALRRIGAHENILIFEDSRSGIKGAANVGASVVAIRKLSLESFYKTVPQIIDVVEDFRGAEKYFD